MCTRKAISDFKNVCVDVCKECRALDVCGGLLNSDELVYSAHPLAPYAAVL
jgi:hypothetical protein